MFTSILADAEGALLSFCNERQTPAMNKVLQTVARCGAPSRTSRAFPRYLPSTPLSALRSYSTQPPPPPSPSADPSEKPTERTKSAVGVRPSSSLSHRQLTRLLAALHAESGSGVCADGRGAVLVLRAGEGEGGGEEEGRDGDGQDWET